MFLLVFPVAAYVFSIVYHLYEVKSIVEECSRAITQVDVSQLLKINQKVLTYVSAS